MGLSIAVGVAAAGVHEVSIHSTMARVKLLAGFPAVFIEALDLDGVVGGVDDAQRAELGPGRRGSDWLGRICSLGPLRSADKPKGLPTERWLLDLELRGVLSTSRCGEGAVKAVARRP